MRLYETMVIFDARLPDASIEESVNRVLQLVTERGGEPAKTERWGRRRLAYEIRDLEEGYYVVFTYRLDPSKVRELESALPFVEGFVRAKTLNPEAHQRKAS